MCPYTLTHNKMLASTMQHSTHNHTPTPQPPPHPLTPHKGQPDALGDQARSGHQEHNPTGRLLRTQQCAEPVHVFWHHVPPSHTPRHARGVEITRRKPTTTRRRLAPHTGKLLRKEVIQPHLPVRLPCYDFVPIAGPTFDHSPPTSGLGHGLRVLPTFVT